MKDTQTVSKDRIPYLREKLAKFNKKCYKLNCPEMTLTVHDETENVRHELSNGMVIDAKDLSKYSKYERIVRTTVYIDVTLEYEIPVIDGWELICTFDIEHDPEGNAIVFTSKVPDKELPSQYLNKDEIHCDHCGHNRYRTHSMLMRKIESGRYKEVGSTCVKDFFGHDPKNLLWMARISLKGMIDDVDEKYFGEGGGGHYCYDLDNVLSYTALAIRLHGWTSRGAAYDDPSKTATTEDMFYYMYPPRGLRESEKKSPNEADIELARKTREHFENLDPGDNDYLNNCVKVVKVGYVPVKQVGVTCSMIASYKNHIRKNLEKKHTKESNYVGEVGDRLEVKVECVFMTEIDSYYGPSELYIFVDSDGNKYKTFYSGSKWGCDQGDIVTLKGTVKKHETYNGSKDTVLTRCFGKVEENDNN
jgi:hypothetical protein